MLIVSKWYPLRRSGFLNPDSINDKYISVKIIGKEKQEIMAVLKDGKSATYKYEKFSIGKRYIKWDLMKAMIKNKLTPLRRIYKWIVLFKRIYKE